MDYILKDLLDIPRLRELLDSLDQLHGMPSAILDTEGNILTATAWQDICTKFHRIHPVTSSKCTESDRHIKARLGELAPYTIYRCPMGLIDAAMPIIIEDQHLGNVFTGQLFLESPDKVLFIEQAHKYGFDEQEYISAINKVPLYSEEKLLKNLNIIHDLTQMLAEQGLKNLRLKEAQEKQKYRNKTLEMIATDQPLSSILEAIVTGVEHIMPSIVCSVLLLDQNGTFLKLVAAPSIPEFYNSAIDGLKIGAEVGSCGTAAYTGRRIIVDDIMTHPYWSFYKDLAAKAGLAACWSDPIRSSTGQILGTFAVYHPTPHKPSDSEIFIIEQSTHLASIAIEKKLTTERLRASEEQHRSLIKTALDGIWLTNTQGSLLEVNDAYCRMSGYNEQELLKMNISGLDINETLEDTVNRIASISENGHDRFESQHRRKDGSIYNVEVNVQFRPVNGGQCVAFLRDITERKHAEAALAEQADFALRVFNSTDANMAVVDHNGIIIGVNEAWRRFAMENIGDDEQIWGTGFNYFVQYDDKWGDAALAKESFEGVRNVQNGQLPFFSLEYPCHSKDTQKRWFRLKVTPLQGKEGSVLIAHIDITKRKLAEIALIESRRLLAETEKIGKVGGWEFNVDSKVQTWTREIYRIHEVDKSFIPTLENGINFYTSESRPIIERSVQRAIEFGEPFDEQLEIITAKGNHRYVHAIGNADLISRRVFGFFQDISERKQSERYREITREVLKVLNEQGDTEKIIHNVIKLLKQKTGFSAVGIRLQVGDDFPYRSQDGFSEDFLLREGSILERTESSVCLNSEGKVSLECTCGLVISGKTDSSSPFFTKGGSFFTSQSDTLLDIPPNEDPRLHPRNSCIHAGYSSVALVPIRNEEHIIGLIQFNDHRKGCFNRDTIEQLEEIAAHLGAALMRKQAEEEKLTMEKQFLQAQKMESLGVLAGGIAHDFNNILAVIVGNCSLATRNPQSCGKYIQIIEQASERAAELCRQMLSYAGKAKIVHSSIDFNLLINEMVKMLKSTINKNILVTYEGVLDLPSIIGDASQLRQIVMNLIINAADAIGESHGEIRLALQKVQFKGDSVEKDYQGITIKPGWYAFLEVKDNGCGMTDEIKQRIFEPFFTTKFAGRGLGMSAVLGIIKAHSGALQLLSKPEQGTTFNVYLPIKADNKIFENSLSQCLLEKCWRGEGTILLVEDEALILQVARALLEELGFRIIEASNGREAIELYQKNSSDITLVITDLGMPVMDGYELIREIKKLNPKIPIVVTSGFGDFDINTRVKEDSVAAVISKPYNIRLMQDVLRKILEI